jgi:hypothetical protein
MNKYYGSVTDGIQTSREVKGLYVYVDFLYTVCPSELSGLLLTRTSKQDTTLFCSTSIAKLVLR